MQSLILQTIVKNNKKIEYSTQLNYNQKMFIKHLRSLKQSLPKFPNFSSLKSPSSFKILDIKNSHLLFIKDPQSTLPYMSEIVTEKGEKGIVIKLEQNGTSVIGMYENVDKKDQIDIVGWTGLKNQGNFVPEFNAVYGIGFGKVGEVRDVEPNRFLQCKLNKEGKRARIQTLAPLLALQNDIFVGDLVAFSGPLGSGRTNNAVTAIECFTNSDISQPVGIYLNTNPNDFKQKCQLAASKYRTFSFGRTTTQLSQLESRGTIPSMSSVGVYMLAVKCINVANKLKRQGKNVMLVVDNIHEILANQWTVLQSLKLAISPFSILNQIYASSSKGHLGKNQKDNEKSGSLTTIAITSPQTQDVIQQYTTFGNNTKYLRTLCPQITHPLQLTVNSNHITSSKLENSMRRKINKFVREKKEKQLLTKLKLTRDQPWEHYFILDAQWWVQALRSYRPVSLGDRDLFFWFIDTNVEEDYVSHWKISCIDAYNRYLDYLARPEDPRMGMEMSQLQNFIELCKSEELFDVFKKDYLN